jgi:asparagine synthase (glutamine-hydrolysing)
MRIPTDVAVKSAEFYNVKHEKINVTAEDTALNVERAIYHTEMPLLNPHSIAKFCLAEFAHQKGFVVALTGEGSDELLLGYSPFRMDVILDMRARGQGDKVDKLMDDFKKKEAKGAAIMLGQFPAESPR